MVGFGIVWSWVGGVVVIVKGHAAGNIVYMIKGRLEGGKGKGRDK